ncbi:MAG: L-seryl-tRNA(Sec) selenium transferase [Anaerolineales bacterium]
MNLRNLPSVESLLQTEFAAALIADYGRPLTLNAIRSALDSTRKQISVGEAGFPPQADSLLANAAALLSSWTQPTLRGVINATGVILHTNLGRAPLSAATIAAMDLVSRGYSNLEYDLAKGARGSRLIHAEAVLQRLTGAESAMVVNNNASAVLLALSALANKKRVVISRAQLVEIGGGFRVPDVMKQSGAKLVEIGTTNKTHLRDYEEALQEPAALVMRAHPSNFKVIGFTSEPNLSEIVRVAHERNVAALDDLGSGALLDTAKYGFAHEPTVQESLAAGMDVVCFSGDKLLGGPQAGIIVGRKDLLDKIKKHPLARAVRADKTCLAGITATLLHYLKDEAEREIPIWRMMSMPLDEIRQRAEAWRAALGQGTIEESESTVGGGSLPTESIPTFALALSVKSADKFLKRLREGNPPVIARTVNDKIFLDPRTVLSGQDEALLSALQPATCNLQPSL